MKKDKKLEEEFKKTDEGKRLYSLNIVGYIFYILTVILLVYIIFNQGKELTGLIAGFAIFAVLFSICASFIVSLYYFTLQDYINKKTK